MTTRDLATSGASDAGGWRPLLWGEAHVGQPSEDTPSFVLPVGTVTFLLTDVEGSTRLWENDPQGAAEAIARHHEIVGEAVAGSGGVRPLEQGEGDSVVAAFARPSDALACALAVQRRLLSDPVTAPRLQVRIGISTGEAQLRDERTYFGQSITRCARLRDVAWGGQIVCSRSTYDLGHDHIGGPGLVDASFRHLGAHRLRDLARPEHVYQLCHPDLPADFPPLRSLDTVPNNLPLQLTSFIGREREMRELRELLADTRLLTLTGSGGCGKTRLALQLAADASDRYPDGVWWVDLSRIRDGGLVADAVAHSLSVRAVPGQAVLDTLARHLGTRSCLVVVDNCEHLVDACATTVDELLRACPGLDVLATSREALAVPGETRWRVPSLSLPATRERPPVESLDQSEAVRLFIERAGKVRPGFTVTNANAPSVAEICHRLDGIPLALELAAAQLRLLSPEQVAAGLRDRFRLLGTGPRTALPRQATLTASVDWSHDLLSDEERLVFRRLSVFVGGFDLAAAAAVAAGGPVGVDDVPELVARLVDRSLVLAEDGGARVRYSMLETVRHYASDRLRSCGEEVDIRFRHLAHVAGVGRDAAPGLRGHELVATLDRLELEAPNLWEALAWSGASDAAAAEEGARLAASVGLFLWARHPSDARGLLEAILGRDDVSGHARAGLAATAAMCAAMLDDIPAAGALADEARALALASGDEAVVAQTTGLIAYATSFVDPAAAFDLYREAAAAARRVGDHVVLATQLNELGRLAFQAGDIAAATAHLTEARALADRTGYRLVLAETLVDLALIATFEGMFDAATTLLDEAVAVSLELGERYWLPMAYVVQGLVALELGADDRAATLLQEGRATAEEFGNLYAAALADVVACRLLVRRGDLGSAAPLAGGLQAMLDLLGVGLPAVECIRSIVAYALAAGDTATALRFSEQAIAAPVEQVGALGRGRALAARSEVALAAEDVALAEDLASEALRLLHAVSARPSVAEALEILAAAAAAQESATEATRLLSAAHAARATAGSTVRGHQDLQPVLEQALGREAFDAAWAEGAALDLDQAVAYASRGRGERKRPSTGWASLTPTELEVVRLVARGLTNPEVGRRLFIAAGTVKVHLSSVFRKLSLSSRAELAAEAVRRGLDTV